MLQIKYKIKSSEIICSKLCTKEWLSICHCNLITRSGIIISLCNDIYMILGSILIQSSIEYSCKMFKVKQISKTECTV